MFRTLRYGLALTALALLGSAAAQAQTVIAHEADFAFDGINAQYDAYDTFSSPTAVAFARTVPIYGDASTFVWDGSGALTVSNVTTTATSSSADLALTGTGSVLSPLIGYSHYGYASTAGQGLFTTANVGGNTLLSLTTIPADLAGYGTPSTINAAFLGDWTIDGTGPMQINAASFGLPSNFTITKDFVYDPTFDVTFFSAVSTVPEPGVTALLIGLMVPAAGIAFRRRRA